MAVAIVGIPVVLGALYLGGWTLGVLMALVAGVATAEFYALGRARGARPFALVGVTASMGLVLLAAWAPAVVELAPAAFVLVIALALGLPALSVWSRWPGGTPAQDSAVTLLGVLYVGGALAFVPILRALPTALIPELGSRWWAGAFVLLPLLATWAGDSAAYFVGRAVGRHKLAPLASPGKTVEGALAGLAGAALAGAALVGWSGANLEALNLGPVAGAWMGLVVGAAAQVGDLAESVLKREAGVKDSGRLLPGHGGMLDRVDSLLFAFPVTWTLLAAMGMAS